MTRAHWTVGVGAIAFSFLSLGCGGSGGSGAGGAGTGTGGSGASTGTGAGGAGTGGGGSGAGGAACGPDVQAPDETLPDTTDPEAGDFTMDEALVELPEGPGPLRAIIDTDLGALTCEMRPDVAPIGVANFVGLARGRRAWKDPLSKKWVRRRFYDGLTFHRVIPEFVAQGGDPLGTGTGGPGYHFINEIGSLTHDPGALAYANVGNADSNGSQFYVTETAKPQLDGGYTIFGFCTPIDVVVALTHVQTSGPPADKPTTPLHMKTVTITRCAP